MPVLGKVCTLLTHLHLWQPISCVIVLYATDATLSIYSLGNPTILVRLIPPVGPYSLIVWKWEYRYSCFCLLPPGGASAVHYIVAEPKWSAWHHTFDDVMQLTTAGFPAGPFWGGDSPPKKQISYPPNFYWLYFLPLGALGYSPPPPKVLQLPPPKRWNPEWGNTSCPPACSR